MSGTLSNDSLDLVTLVPQLQDTNSGILEILKKPWVIAMIVIVSTAIMLGFCCYVFRLFKRRSRRQGYSNLRENLYNASELYTKKRVDVTEEERDLALMYCSFYLRSRPNLQLLRPLAEIGSRAQRQWFIIQDNMTFDTKLLTLTKVSDTSTLTFSNTTLKSLQQLLSLLKHPFLCPVEDIGFQVDQQHVITVLPYHVEGSLKDYIHRCPITADWEEKYSTGGGQPLNLQEVQLFGRQILAGILYLKNRGFSWIGHIHTGNILMSNGICRLAGYENTLMGLSPFMDDILGRYCYGNMKQFDILSFGHVMYEMAVGQPLTNVIPSMDNYYTIPNEEIKTVLNYIFKEESGDLPNFKKINFHPFFKNIVLSELSLHKPMYSDVPEHIKTLLKKMKSVKVLQRYPYMYEPTRLWIRPRKEYEMSLGQSSGRDSPAGAKRLYNVNSVTFKSSKPVRIKKEKLKKKDKQKTEQEARAPSPQVAERSSLLEEIRKGAPLRSVPRP